MREARSLVRIGHRLPAAAATATVLLLCVGASVASGSPTHDAGWATGPSWSNGVVRCNFNESAPTAGISRTAAETEGLVVTLASVTELSALDGSTVGALGATAWTRTNSSGTSQFEMEYTAPVSVVAPSAPSIVLGSAHLRVDYRLPARAATPTGPMDDVTLDLVVTNWTWVGAGDGLVLTLAVWPASAPTDHLSVGSATVAGVANVADADGETREYLSLPSSAGVSNGTGPLTSVAVTPSMTVSANRAAVALHVDPGAGAYRTLEYAATVEVPAPPPLRGTPLYDYAVVAGAGGGVVVLLGVVARRVRRRPSDLIFTEEEES